MMSNRMRLAASIAVGVLASLAGCAQLERLDGRGLQIDEDLAVAAPPAGLVRPAERGPVPLDAAGRPYAAVEDGAAKSPDGPAARPVRESRPDR
jgi:hypothetical protein